MDDAARTRAERRTLALLCAGALIVRLGLAFATPAFEAPDERAHHRYVAFLVDEARLPVQPAPDVEDALRFWPQYYQPPLAYALFVPALVASRAAGAGPAAQVRVLRVQNALYGMAMVVLVWLGVARLTAPGDPRALLAAALAAAWPGLAANAASANNDALANGLAVALWLPLLRAHESPRATLAAGALFGAACLAKLTVLPLAPLLLAVPWLRGGSARCAAAVALRAGALAFAVTLPLWLRNAWVYGHPLAVGAGSFTFEALVPVLGVERVAELAAPDPVRALAEVVGQFGVHANLRWWPLPVAWGALAGLAAAGAALRPGPPLRRSTALALALAPALAAVGLVAFSLQYYGGWQGRYLYTAALPVCALGAHGLARWLPAGHERRAVGVLALALCALDLALCAELAAFFAEAPRWRWGVALGL